MEAEINIKSAMERIDDLKKILEENKGIQEILKRAPLFEMPNWYLGAGCIANTVWNAKHGFDLNLGIYDFDLVYYDSSDISYEGEDHYICRSKALFKHLPAPLEIRNQARVHLWYEKHFGYKIKPYSSVEDAIKSWPTTTATCIGVKYDDRGKFIVYAPYGLDDLFRMIVRPNKVQITKEIYLNKVRRWVKIWPKLQIIPWDE